MKLFLIRHAQTNANSQGLTQGSGSEEPLSTIGTQQAFETAKALKSFSIQNIISSPSRRAIQTATAIGNELNLPVEIQPELTERNWGDWDMQPWTETQHLIAQLTPAERPFFTPPNGESEVQIAARLHTSVHFLKNTEAEGIIIVTHLAILNILIPLLLGETLENKTVFKIPNASISTLERQASAFTVVHIGDTSHLGSIT